MRSPHNTSSEDVTDQHCLTRKTFFNYELCLPRSIQSDKMGGQNDRIFYLADEHFWWSLFAYSKQIF